MKLFHTLPLKHAEDDICHRYLKVATIENLNDPFECLAFASLTQDFKQDQFNTKTQLNNMIGLLCFSDKWTNPAIWSHYGDNHNGLCLGFEIPDKRIEKVNYFKNRLPFPIGEYLTYQEWYSRVALAFISTKADIWAYENEFRILVDLNSCIRKNNLYYYPLGNDLILQEIIIGFKSEKSITEISQFANSYNLDIHVTKASLSNSLYEMI